MLRRRVVRRSTPAFDDATSRIFIRLGVAAFIGIFGLLAGTHGNHSRSGNEIYFDAVVEFDDSLSKHLIAGPDLRRRVEALPISAVTDPKLKEYHSILLQLVSALEAGDDARAKELLTRYDAVVDEINSRYGRT